MSPNENHKILFEPVKIGPKTTKNRFYQVPHCTGMGYRYPKSEAQFRGMKAEGGWGVVSTQEVEIHPTSDLTPYNEGRLWDDRDIPSMRLMTDAVHEHGALAGAELWYGGARTANLMTREVSMDIASMPNLAGHPYQTRAMDKEDIRNLRLWHRNAALRARDAGFDIVYETSYPLGTQDLSPVIKGAAAAAPDAFVAWSYPPDTFGLTEQAMIENLDVKAFYTAVATPFPSYGTRFGAAAEGILGAGGVNPASPAFMEYAAAHEAVTGAKPDYWASATTYASLEILGQAIA